MKALFVLDTLYRGGAEMQALDVCRNAAANGLDLSVAVCGGGALEHDFENAGIPYYRFQRTLPVDPLLALRLRSLIKREGFDVVHADQAVDGLHAYLGSLGTSAKRVLSFHGHFADEKNLKTIKFLLPREDANISCSSGLTAWLNEQPIGKTEFHLIYNGVDQKRLAYNGPDLREELGLSPDTLLFGMVAHFYPAARKDQMTLCRSFVEVAAELSNAHLVLVGRVVEGVEEKFAECERICTEGGVSDRVHFLGQRDDLAKIISALDIYIFSSIHEGLPISLMEAMLTRKATILSDIGPHLEVSENGKYSLLFETGNAVELASKMFELATNLELRERIANDAFEKAQRSFGIEAHIRNLKELYSVIIAN